MHPSYLLMSLGLASLVLCMVYLRTIVTITPSLVACIFRGKETINLEESASLARMRNIVFMLMLLPASIFVSWFNEACLDFAAGMSPALRYAVYLGIIALYAGTKAILNRALRPSGAGEKLWAACLHSFRNYIVIMTVICLSTAGIMELFGAQDATVRLVTLIAAGAGYMVYLLRRMQVFASFRGLFSSFLYLCALELLPTGLVVAAAVIF